MKDLSRPLSISLTALLVVGSLGLWSCTECPEPPAPIDTAAEADAIMALEREWSAKFGEDDVDWIMGIHAADAQQLPPDAPMIQGTEALREAWVGMATAEGVEISWEPTYVYVDPAGTMAYDVGSATLSTPGGTQPMKYMVVWVKQDGEWKVAADMFNATGPMEPTSTDEAAD